MGPSVSIPDPCPSPCDTFRHVHSAPFRMRRSENDDREVLSHFIVSRKVDILMNAVTFSDYVGMNFQVGYLEAVDIP